MHAEDHYLDSTIAFGYAMSLLDMGLSVTIVGHAEVVPHERWLPTYRIQVMSGPFVMYESCYLKTNVRNMSEKGGIAISTIKQT